MSAFEVEILTAALTTRPTFARRHHMRSITGLATFRYMKGTLELCVPADASLCLILTGQEG